MSNPANQLPPEYDDYQPSDYDPEFTADISTKMRVPERIGVANGDYESDEEYSARQRNRQDQESYSRDNIHRSAAMNVPDKIIVLGQDQHGAVKDLPNLHLDFVPNRTVDPYVGLSTPPRVLTMEERFPHIEDPDDYESDETPKHYNRQSYDGVQNGYMTPVRKRNETLEEEALRATPGDPLLIADEGEDELSVLRKRLNKLSLHVYRLDEENARRSQREWLLYPLVMIYFVFKMGRWFVPK